MTVPPKPKAAKNSAAPTPFKASTENQSDAVLNGALLRHFGERVRSLREQHGWTQAQMAVVVGIAQGKFTAIETGNRDCRLSTVRRVATALGVRIQDLLPPE